MEKERKSPLNMFTMLMLFGMIPMVVSVVAISVVSILVMQSDLRSETQSTIKIAACALAGYYEDKLADDGEIAREYSYVDSMQVEGG